MVTVALDACRRDIVRSAMPFNLSQIFPISDAPSARLMKLKALCLFRAGVLTEPQRALIKRKADEILTRPASPMQRRLQFAHFLISRAQAERRGSSKTQAFY